MFFIDTSTGKLKVAFRNDYYEKQIAYHNGLIVNAKRKKYFEVLVFDKDYTSNRNVRLIFILTATLLKTLSMRFVNLKLFTAFCRKFASQESAPFLSSLPISRSRTRIRYVTNTAVWCKIHVCLLRPAATVITRNA